LATNNRGKLDELRVLFAGIDREIVSPADVGLQLDVAETGHTYAINARLKARAFASASGLLTLADDSGLEVDALSLAPGVHSSRWAGPMATDAQKIAYLLSQMTAVPPEQRSACFCCVMAIAAPKARKIRLSSGSWQGFITMEPHGIDGFGYDPVFYLHKFGMTAAEIPAWIKNHISHRARAAAGARRILLEEHQQTP